MSQFIERMKVANHITIIAGGFLFMLSFSFGIFLNFDFNYLVYLNACGIPAIWFLSLYFAIKKKAKIVPLTDEEKVAAGVLRPIGEIVRAVGNEGVCSKCKKIIMIDEILVKHSERREHYYNHFKHDPKRKVMIDQYYSDEKRRAYPELNLLKDELT